jgi:hypothetical protein
MLAIAIGGSGVAHRLRAEAGRLRAGSGVVIAAVALGFVFHVDDHLTNVVPGYLKFFQDKAETSKAAQRDLQKLRGGKHVTQSAGSSLEHYGQAPDFHADGDWFNSPPLSIASLPAMVVLVDF